jgi:hypothetical protein
MYNLYEPRTAGIWLFLEHWLLLMTDLQYVNEEADREKVKYFNDAEHAASQEQASRPPDRHWKHHASHQHSNTFHLMYNHFSMSPDVIGVLLTT